MNKIRNEEKADYDKVEEITRRAFYNEYVLGCNEHYLVHIMRGHEDFVPELAFVIEVDGNIIGNIMYTKATLTDKKENEKTILTFGPISILPEHQRMGYGKMLMEYSFEKAREIGYDTIVIYGSPANYVSSGFKSCKKYKVCNEQGKYPTAMMVKELIPDVLKGKEWIYKDSPIMQIDEKSAEIFDNKLEKMDKKHQPSQEEFYILSQSFID
jgi:Predicted acetyltransferase